MSKQHILFLLSLFAIVSILFSLSQGSTSLSFYQLFTHHNLFNQIFFELRLPRTLTAFICGALLALAGSLIQLLLQNPLADPYALGISGGAATLTLLMMLMGLSDYWLVAGAWVGSLITIFFILVLAKKHHWRTHTLLLSGIALACGYSACISLILILSPDASIHSMLFWLAGDLNDINLPWFALIILLIGGVICCLLAPGFNILSLGEKEARALGLSSTYYRIIIYLLTSLFTATAVTISGCIGFIGLITPHLLRRLVGFDHRLIIPGSILLGGSLLTFADTFSRTLFSPQQIPVGIIIAIIGVPSFIWLLQK